MSGAVQLIGAASFLYAGRAVRSEMRQTAAPSAGAAFAVWWSAIGAYLAIEGAMTIAGALGYTALVPWLVVRYLGYVLIGAGLWGLTYYVAFVWTGRQGLRVPLAVLFAALSATLIGYFVTRRPLSVVAQDWLVGFTFAAEPTGPLYTAILTGFALPPIAAAFGYLSLWSRTQRRDQRYRIALVSVSIILYLGSGLVVRLGTNDFLMFVNLALFGLGMAAAVLLAYRPPRAIRAWLGIGATGYRPQDEREKERMLRREALARRCRDLV